MRHRLSIVLVAGALVWIAACQHAEPAKQYTLTGQILAVVPAQQELSIKHDDIPGFMPAMTMNYAVATPKLLEGRTPGETISATLEVRGSVIAITSITHTGTAPLPVTANARSMAVNLLAEGDEVPDTALIDSHDKRRSFSEWKGSLTLVTFIYTSCPMPNFCPLMDQNFATIQRTVAEDPALKGQVKLLSISFDPEHDTPQVLAKHAAGLKADPAVWTFVTADKEVIDTFTGRFGVGLVASDQPGQIIHNLRTALVGRDGRIIKFYTGGEWTPGAVLADMRAAAAHAS